MLLNRYRRAMVMQLEAADCGVACLATIAKYYGREVLLEKLRSLSGTTANGTTLLGLKLAAEHLGFESEGYTISLNQLASITGPLIIPVAVNNHNHYWVVFTAQDDQFWIGDPSRGALKVKRSEIERHWTTGVCLKLLPTSSFQVGREVTNLRFSTMRKMIGPDVPVLSGSAFLGVFISLTGLSVAVFSQKLLDVILPQRQTDKLIWGLSILAIIIIASVLLTFIRGLLMVNQGRNFNQRTMNLFLSSLLKLPIQFFESRKTGEIISRLKDTGRIQSAIASLSGSLTTSALVLTFSTLLVFYYSWIIGIIYSLSIPLFLLLAWKYQPKLIAAQRGVLQASATTESCFIDTLQGIGVIKQHNSKEFFAHGTSQQFSRFQSQLVETGKLGLRYNLVSGLVGTVFSISVLSFLSYQVIHEAISVGQMVAILTISGSILPTLNSLSGANIQIQEALVSLQRIIEFAGLEEEARGNPNTRPNQTIEVDFDEVQFGFPGKCTLLSNLNFQVATGELVLLEGPNGVGKSSTLKILQKLYWPTQGQVLVNGINLNDYDLGQWRATVGVVPQRIHLFNGSVAENISLRPGKSSQAQVERLCAQYGLQEFFLTLPSGYDTPLGEGGLNLSGGQIQLLGLARALYISPKLLLLDEALSAMDSAAAGHVLNLLQILKNEMAIVVVTHKLESNLAPDRAYILSPNGTDINPNPLRTYQGR